MLDNPRASTVRKASRLQQRAARSETGLFLLEGPQAIDELLAHRPELVVEVFATEDASLRHPDLVRRAADVGPLHEASERVIKALADTVQPQGIVAVVRQSPVSIEDALAHSDGLVAILHEIRDPGNLGTILRVADSAGASAVIVTASSVDVHNPKVVRSTTGSLFHLDVVVGIETTAAIAASRAAGHSVLAADVSGRDLLEVEATGALAAPTAWLFGNEARGLDDDTRALADESVRVPVYGRAESMNLATAASVCLYQSAFARARARG